ncbi:ferrous iron transport protein A [Tardiphaga alba]|uniref:Ferrous iron transport protein A n=1 Tax=Tardiphaga alba TaxID=340268 RepID=A0ABX8A3B8_9BRAD|nr:FeoA family protein [Tardiphaga alba]QUS38093.1 ferrous iron transport protein A [Tardiphaga alba]
MTPPNTSSSAPADHHIRLGDAPRGFVGTIVALHPEAAGPSTHELEQYLIEMGFTEGARVEILHQGAIKQDPIAVRVDNITIAVRRREAMAVLVKTAVLVK